MGVGREELEDWVWGNTHGDLQGPPRPSSCVSFKITKLRNELCVCALFVGISKVKRYFLTEVDTGEIQRWLCKAGFRAAQDVCSLTIRSLGDGAGAGMMWVRGRGTDRDQERNRGRNREIDTEGNRDTEKQRGRETIRDRNTQRKAERETERDRDTKRERIRRREREDRKKEKRGHLLI